MPIIAPHFDVVLHPHRSLGPRGFALLMGFIIVVSFAAGLSFTLIGAWPVFGFFGLDVLAIYVAFRLSYRAGRLRETIQLYDDALVVRRIWPSGDSRRWLFQPYWVRVMVEDDGHGRGRICLTSHGRSMALGEFLTADERLSLADALKQALIRWRTAV